MNIDNFYDPEDLRPYLARPFQLNGRTVASNGHVFVSMPEHGDYLPLPNDYLPKFLPLIDKARQGDFVPLPGHLVFPEKFDCAYCRGCGQSTVTKCTECNGEGEVTWYSGFHDYDAECLSCAGDGEKVIPGGNQRCKNCKGTGRVYRIENFVMVLGLGINPNYLKAIIDEPDLEIAIDRKNNKLAFRTSDNFGIIMGMNL